MYRQRYDDDIVKWKQGLKVLTALWLSKISPEFAPCASSPQRGALITVCRNICGRWRWLNFFIIYDSSSHVMTYKVDCLGQCPAIPISKNMAVSTVYGSKVLTPAMKWSHWHYYYATIALHCQCQEQTDFHGVSSASLRSYFYWKTAEILHAAVDLCRKQCGLKRLEKRDCRPSKHNLEFVEAISRLQAECTISAPGRLGSHELTQNIDIASLVLVYQFRTYLNKSLWAALLNCLMLWSITIATNS